MARIMDKLMRIGRLPRYKIKMEEGIRGFMTCCLCLGIFFSGCQGKDPARKVIFVYSHKVDYEPIMVAFEKGYFKEEGVDVTAREVVGGIQAAEAIATGAADMGAMGDAPAIIITSKRESVKIVTRYGGGEKMHRVIVQKGINTPRDLEGKSVGIQLGSSTHGGFIQWAEKNGIHMERVKLVSINPTDMPDAMKTFQIDAMAGSEPWPTNVESHCKESVNELGDFSDVGNTFPLVLVATERLISESPETIEGIVCAVKRGAEFIHQHFEEAAHIAMTYTGLSLENQKRCMGSLFWEVGFNQTDLKSLTMTAQFLRDFGKIDTIPDFKRVVSGTTI